MVDGRSVLFCSAGPRLTNRWSGRGCRRDEAANGWEVALRVVERAGHGPPRGSAPPLASLP
jgi:hypothetical protein